jgi:hypothetical protein
MDKRTPPEQRLLTDALEAMARLGLHFKVQKREARQQRAQRVGAVLDLRLGGRQIHYAAEVKRALRPATLGPLVHQLRGRAGRPLLVADHVTPPLADALRTAGVEFIDGAGNAFLHQPPTLVFVKGQRPTGLAAPAERGRAFQATGLQVLFALLARPDLVGRPYREIAVAAGVAHGTVGWVMAELPGLGHVAAVGGRRRLINGELLLDRWTEAYARTLRPRLLLGRFRGALETVQVQDRWPQGVLAGAEIAAARLTRHLRPGTATFYAPAIEPKVLLKLALRADAEGNVEFRRRFWDFPADDPLLTPTLLVYADLLAIGDARCLEAAQLLRGPLLARLV